MVPGLIPALRQPIYRPARRIGKIERSCQAMDFRVRMPRIRVVPPPEQRLRSLVQGADQAEAFTEKVFDKTRPYLAKLHFLRTRLATLAVALLAIWIFFHVTFGANGMVIYRAKRAEYQSIEKDIGRLQKENGAYNQQVDELRNDPKRIEREAREQFHYARPGEIIYVSPDSPAPPLPTSHSAKK
jgi:cell division protein FtsB